MEHNVLPPCYESCAKSISAIKSCEFMQDVGVEVDKVDNCLGFPREAENGEDVRVCIVKPGPSSTTVD